MPFDPDAYLAEKSTFDPDAYLQDGFDPDVYLGIEPAPVAPAPPVVPTAGTGLHERAASLDAELGMGVPISSATAPQPTPSAPVAPESVVAPELATPDLSGVAQMYSPLGMGANPTLTDEGRARVKDAGQMGKTMAESITASAWDIVPSWVRGAKQTVQQSFKPFADHFIPKDSKLREAWEDISETPFFQTMMATPERFIDESGQLEKSKRAELRELSERHGKAAVAINELTKSVVDTTTYLSTMRLANVQIGGTPTAAAGDELAAQMMARLKSAGKLGLFRAITSEADSLEERAKIGSITALYMGTPAASGLFESARDVFVADLIYNSAITAPQVMDLWQSDDMGDFDKILETIKMVGADIAFSAMTRTMRSDPLSPEFKQRNIEARKLIEKYEAEPRPKVEDQPAVGAKDAQVDPTPQSPPLPEQAAAPTKPQETARPNKAHPQQRELKTNEGSVTFEPRGDGVAITYISASGDKGAGSRVMLSLLKEHGTVYSDTESRGGMSMPFLNMLRGMEARGEIHLEEMPNMPSRINRAETYKKEGKDVVKPHRLRRITGEGMQSDNAYKITRPSKNIPNPPLPEQAAASTKPQEPPRESIKATPAVEPVQPISKDGTPSETTTRTFVRDDGKSTIKGEVISETDTIIEVRTSPTETKRLNKKFYSEDGSKIRPSGHVRSDPVTSETKSNTIQDEGKSTNEGKSTIRPNADSREDTAQSKDDLVLRYPSIPFGIIDRIVSVRSDSFGEMSQDAGGARISGDTDRAKLHEIGHLAEFAISEKQYADFVKILKDEAPRGLHDMRRGKDINDPYYIIEDLSTAFAQYHIGDKNIDNFPQIKAFIAKHLSSPPASPDSKATSTAVSSSPADTAPKQPEVARDGGVPKEVAGSTPAVGDGVEKIIEIGEKLNSLPDDTVYRGNKDADDVNRLLSSFDKDELISLRDELGRGNYDDPIDKALASRGIDSQFLYNEISDYLEQPTYRTIAEARKATGAMRKDLTGKPGEWKVREGFVSKTSTKSNPVKKVEKVDKPSEAIAEVKDEMQNPDNKRPAGEIKSDIIKQIEKALKDAPEPNVYNTTDYPDVKFDIPGDGSFTIRNNKYAVGELLKRAKKLGTKRADVDRPDPAETVKAGDTFPQTRADITLAIRDNPEAAEEYRKQYRNKAYNKTGMAKIEKAFEDAGVPLKASPAPKPVDDMTRGGVGDVAAAAKETKQGGYVSTPDRAGISRIGDQTGRFLKRWFTPSQGMDKGTRQAVLQRKRDKASSVLAGTAQSTLFKQARISLIKKHGKEKVGKWMQDVVYGEKTVDEFRKEFDLERTHTALKVLNNFNKNRQKNSAELSRLLEEAGAPADLVEKIRDNDFYISRFYMKHLMGDEFVPEKADYDAATMEIRAGIEDAVLNLAESATKATGKTDRTNIDIVEYMKTRDASMLDGMSDSRRQTIQRVVNKFDKLNQVIDSVVYDESGAVKVNVSTDALLDASRSTVDYFLNRKQAGTGEIDTSHLKKRFLEGAFRSLYKEVTDPVFTTAKTIESQEQLIANMTMFNFLVRESEGKAWTDMPSNKLGTEHKLGSEQNPSDRMKYGKLAGKYVTKELYDTVAGGHQSNAIFKWAWFKPMGVMRGMKLLGPKTIVRNYAEAYLGFAVGNGDALRTGYGKNYKRATDVMNAFVLPANAEGRLGKKAEAQKTVEGLIRDGAFSLRGNTSAEEVVNLLTEDPRNWLGNKFKKSMELYSMIDFPTKAAAFWTMEEHLLAKGMSPAEAKKGAAEHVQRFYQNPDALPEVMGAISKTGITDYAGYFIDSIRIRKNQIDFAIKSAKEGDMKPMVGLSLSASADAVRRSGKIAALTVGLRTSWIALQQWIRDNDEDVEKADIIEGGTRQAAIREFMPEWYKDSPLLVWEETRKDGSKQVFYSALGGNSAFPLEDMIFGALQAEVDNKRVPESMAKNLLNEKLNPVNPGMYPSALWKLLSGDSLGSSYQSTGVIEAINGNHPDRNKIIMESVAGFASDIYLGQFGSKIQQSVAIKRKQAGDEPKAGTFTPHRSIQEVWTSMFNPTRTYALDANEAEYLVRNRALAIRNQLSVSKGKVSARYKAMETYGGATTKYHDTEAKRGQILRRQYLGDVAGVYSNATTAFGGVLTDKQILKAIKAGANVTDEELKAVVDGTVGEIQDYVPASAKQPPITIPSSGRSRGRRSR